MRPIFKYLKPYVPLVLLAIVLLFVQANADLALPDYMSRIVNVGIQQGGVISPIPDAMRKSEMDHLALFLSESDAQRVLGDYTLVESGSADAAAYVKTYPALANEPIYALKPVDEAEAQWLEATLPRVMLAVSGLTELAQDPAKAQALGSGMGIDLAKLPAGTDIFQVLANVPAQNRMAMLQSMQAQFGGMDDAAIRQAAIRVVSAEYAALGADTSRLQNNYILSAGGIMLLITLLTVACTVSVGFLSARTAAGFARDLREGIFAKVESFSSAEFDRFSSASLITRTTNDITQIQMTVVMLIRMVFYAPIIGVGGIFRALGKSSSMWWIIALGVGVLIVMVAIVMTLSTPRFRIIQKLTDRLNLVARENLTGMMVIRAFNMQGFEEQRFDAANKDLTATNLFVNRVMVFMFPGLFLIMNLMTVLITWVGAHQIASSNMQVGDMMAFMQYATQIVFSFMMMSFMFILVPRAVVSGQRIGEVLATELTIHDPARPKQFPTPFRGEIEFRDVGFRYPDADENVLCGVNFTARPGETTAIIGSTGSGKSTVISLIPRFYDVTEGQILIDGVDIREVTQAELRDKIGYIPQKATLFSGTIESNLRYANEHAIESELRQAAEIAQATEFIDARTEAMAATIAQGGMNVSGGQKQRLSIARALVKRAPIYIFDDSFSALDFKTDAALRRAMKENTADSALIIVTQRVSTIKNAEQIIVLDDGEVVGRGTHEQLMDDCETYREIALSQLSMEELA